MSFLNKTYILIMIILLLGFICCDLFGPKEEEIKYDVRGKWRFTWQGSDDKYIIATFSGCKTSGSVSVEYYEPLHIQHFSGSYQVDWINVHFEYTSETSADKSFFEGKFNNKNTMSGRGWKSDDPLDTLPWIAVKL